ncbi:electron transport complex subunit RsxC [Sedimenticola thiotaurini]|uniref:Ion-translocating oxidoreductase complex subunit C n=1 Tax=Sedimenticola thiotaurini TaxID=1543721 RepID=A0A0F7JZC5_9GAMM|nr:electron transport complex subunit RsxC [Sedimenticola thiotaurini]AKH21656.1 hypothetical protein AAY24_16300 [Sedimenticola thiotaurini]
MRRLWSFPGGIRLPGFKQLSNREAVRPLPLPERLFLPLRQHIGAPARPLVAVGERVCKGQLVAEATAFVSAPVHASTSGVVTDIGEHRLPHPSGIAEPCIVIEADGEERWHPDLVPYSEPDNATPEQLLATIRQAGIVGLGGAVFPSAAKLKPPHRIDTLIINGVECEPYITCDDLLMRSRAEAVLRGCLLLQRILAADQCILAVEDNKPEALAQLRLAREKLIAADAAGAGQIELVAIPTVFPAGGEKQLIKVLTGCEVPAGGLPYELGIVCLNVATTAAVHDAILLGRPLVSRLVTVTGSGIRHPGNYQVPLGTPIAALLEAAGGADGEAELIMGGPMMGQRLPTPQAMVVKGTNCILVNKPEPLPRQMPCIRCGSCADACPMQLLPQQLYWHARGKTFDKLQRYHLDSCIECGCCNLVCPSHIPLVSYFRYAKTEIADQEFKRQRAEESRLRSELRQERLERMQREAEERKARRKAARSKSKKPAPAESSPTETALSQQVSHV